MSTKSRESVQGCGTHLGLEDLERPILSRRPHLLQLGALLIERPYGYTFVRGLVRAGLNLPRSYEERGSIGGCGQRAGVRGSWGGCAGATADDRGGRPNIVVLRDIGSSKERARGREHCRFATGPTGPICTRSHRGVR